MELLTHTFLLLLGIGIGFLIPYRIHFGTFRQPTPEDFDNLAQGFENEKERFAELEVLANMIAGGAEQDEVLKAMTPETREELESYQPSVIKIRRS